MKQLVNSVKRIIQSEAFGGIVGSIINLTALIFSCRYIATSKEAKSTMLLIVSWVIIALNVMTGLSGIIVCLAAARMNDDDE